MDYTGFDLADVVDEAVLRSGGTTATADDVLNVRRSLRLLTEKWAAQGYNTWRIRSKDFFASGVNPVVHLDACIDDILQVNSIVFNSESPMRRISAVEYAQLTTKLTKGRPSQYWLDRQDKPVLNIYPIGSSGTALRVLYMERPEAFTRYGDPENVPGRWLEALVVGVAYDLARKRPPFNEALIARLKAETLDADLLAQRNDRDRARYRYRI